MTEEAKCWALWRQDDWGHRFLVKRGLTKAQAEELARDYEARGHKQTYFVERE